MESKSNIPIRKSWGQNFIFDNNTINKIIRFIEPKKIDYIIEIGPGKGALTIPISKKVKKIIAIEIDPLLANYLKNMKISNLEIINKNILEVKLNQKITNFKIIGNLPYYISSPIIFKFLNIANWNEMVIMVQKELAQRIFSKPNCKEYSRISVLVQTFCNTEKKYEISKNVFRPKPKVDSSIIKLTRKNVNLNFLNYSRFIKSAFRQRRKKIKNNLKNIVRDDILQTIGDKRPENISVKEYIRIFNKYML